MGWVLAITAGWILLAVVAAVVIGRGIRLADRAAARAAAEPGAPNLAADELRRSTADAPPGRHAPAPRPAMRAPMHHAPPAAMRHCVPATDRAAAGRDTRRG
jgi:hypothetical protein